MDQVIAGIESLPFTKSLNEQQLEAVQSTYGPLLVLAGAGTGKTRVLTNRIAYLISTNCAQPSEILAVTFTNKAAKEMHNRVSNLVYSDGLWLGTFHAIAARILRRHVELVGLQEYFSILNQDDQVRLVKNICQEYNVDDKKYPPKLLLAIIQKWKDLGISHANVSSADLCSDSQRTAYMIYTHYQSKLINSNAVDFGDLLLYNLQIFHNNPEVLREYQEKFKFLLVDEYQDTNVAQYLWLRMLAQKHKNICCVGDDDQSIYGWRGAEIGNILRFEKDFAEAKVVRLEQNYRSTNNILKTASSIIANNRGRLGKSLWTKDEDGEKVKLVSLWNDREEADYLANVIKNSVSNGKYVLRDIAILVRASFQTRVLEECFITNTIPYQVIGGLRFYERMEVRDIVSYIRVAYQPSDNLALERIINVPKRSIGESTLSQIQDYAALHKISLHDSIKDMLDQDLLRGKARDSLENLLKMFERWRDLFNIMEHYKVAEVILNESGYLSLWQSEKTAEAEGRVENLKELMKALQDFGSIQEFLEHVSLVSDLDKMDNNNLVNIMTLHAAKGLEFDLVFLPGWEEGVFPHQRNIEENGSVGLEEERRLAYVGITRARKELVITCALNRRQHGFWQNNAPSRFIGELPAESIEKVKISNGLNFTNRQAASVFVKKEQVANIPSSFNSNKFMPGNVVMHQKFGKGCVVKVQGDHIDVMFQDYGYKKLIDKFLTKI